MPDTPNQALIWLVGVLALALAGALTYAIKNRSDSAGDSDLRAVVDRIEQDVRKLVAAELEFQSKGWASLPPDLSSSSLLTSAIYDLRRDVADLKVKLSDHDQWERQSKYES